jgi:D-alanine-D-alanine ligase
MTDAVKHNFGKVAVLFGGTSAEREVSLMSGDGVLKALRSAGLDAHPFDPSMKPLQALKDEGFKRVFIALHGRGGEDGTLQGALEWLALPYTGSGVKASALAMDKVTTKQIWLQHGLSTPAYRSIDSGLCGEALRAELASLPESLGLPFIMKPPHEGSSIGFTKIESPETALRAFEKAAAVDTAVLAEAFVLGKELTVTILGGGNSATRALPIIEIRAPKGNYDFQNKYYTNETQYLCPAPLSDEVTQKVQTLSIKAYDALGCEGWGRVDVMLRETIAPNGTAQFEPFLLEINTSPGMTGHSLVPIAAKAVGISYEDLCVQILATASLKTLGVNHVE